MPTYEYNCQDCGAHFEALRSMKDSDSPIACKECSSTNTKRKLSVCYVSGTSDRGGSHAGQSGCGGCQGGSCSSCGH
jgi:putative FmdB family regulatory protein